MRKAWIDPLGWLRYIAWHTNNRPEILHAHLPHATFFARWVRLFAPVNVLVDTIHTSHPGSATRQLGYRLSHWLSTQVTCVSDPVARAVLAARIVPKLSPEQNLTVLPNGIVLHCLNPSQARNPAIHQPLRWIAVGRLAPVKDYPTLLRAFAALPGHPTLQIVGSGPQEQPLRQLAAELAIESRVQFAGFQSDVQPLLAAADAFVLSSLWEGLPISVLEASAAGLPVVVTDAKGVRETMLPGETGLIVPVGDIHALANAMSELMALPPNQRQTIGNRGRAFVEARFSLAKIVDCWEQLYSSLLQTHVHPSRWR
jgi:glycosyltransferase involved in cell wall biosynthesis